MERVLHQEITQYLLQRKIPQRINSNREEKKWKKFYEAYQIIEDTLYRKARWPNLIWVVKEGETAPIIFLYHNDPLAGHLGVTKTL